MSAKDRERLYRYAAGVGDAPLTATEPLRGRRAKAVVTAHTAASARDTQCNCDPVGTVEVADRLGVTRHAVDAWRSRDVGFPAPRWIVGGRPAWNWHEIERWAKSTGRLT